MENSYDAMLDDLEKAGANVSLLDAAELQFRNRTARRQQVQAKWVLEQQTRGV